MAPAVCWRCRSPLTKRVWVFARPPGAGADARALYHPMCAVDVDLASAFSLLERDTTPFGDRAAVERVVELRMGAAMALAAQTRGADEASAAAAREAIESVEPARDPRGRPRVRVLVAGSAVARGARLATLVRALAFSGTWTSPTREYCLVLPDNDGDASRPSIGDDPSQPVVGAVFAVLEGVTVLPSERAALLEWNARALPTPVLWITSRRRRRPHVRLAAALDNEVSRYRKVLDDCGFSGDEAQVVRCDDDDGSSLDRLVAALDESIEHIAGPRIDARTPIERIAEQIHTLLDLEREVGLRQVLTRAQMLVTTASARDQQALGEAVSRALFDPAGARLAFEILCAAKLYDSSEAMARWLTEVFDEGRPIGDAFESAVRSLRERAPARALSMLESLVEREEDPDRRAWLEREIARTRTAISRKSVRS
ncbi:MAG: hypothetical protein JNK05_20750 [Myxococcales bacterium]|nr:hypothetical protein [Myxococcales bacterium]